MLQSTLDQNFSDLQWINYKLQDTEKAIQRAMYQKHGTLKKACEYQMIWTILR